MVSDKDTKKAPPHETALKTSGDDGKQAVAKKPSYDDELHSLYTQESKFTSDPDGFGHLPPDERPFPIEPMPNERERLPFKMTDEDRMRRKIYLKSLELTDREPAYVPEIETMIYNPIRRFYRVPTDKLFKALGPFIGQERVPLFRVLVPKFFILWMGGCVLWYNLKYGRQKWEEKGGWTVIQTRGRYFPGEEKPAEKKKWDYYDGGFQQRKVFKGDDYAY